MSDDTCEGRLAKVHAHRSEIRAAARRAGATHIAVVGSVARGEDGPASDIDFLVDVDVREVGLFPLMDLARELEQVLGERVDVASRPRARRPRGRVGPRRGRRRLIGAGPSRSTGGDRPTAD
ncbi:hypothetical protein CTKZ_19540 [Cellulomonas algicola]|uniref:Polymerase nucleotidyl transferase domain-containing protein n=1 Tax=Cellulomonas algicola TaxID=2071633 RepID=A0A401V0G3_9CELL|nr:nucleotidyltransferase domain-containing protein [Cellulomonas algicola]GCD20392.1 hypothetical protein CTKZ_19540 [Cellulomonas algicola]